MATRFLEGVSARTSCKVHHASSWSTCGQAIVLLPDALLPCNEEVGGSDDPPRRSHSHRAFWRGGYGGLHHPQGLRSKGPLHCTSRAGSRGLGGPHNPGRFVPLDPLGRAGAGRRCTKVPGSVRPARARTGTQTCSGVMHSITVATWSQVPAHGPADGSWTQIPTHSTRRAQMLWGFGTLWMSIMLCATHDTPAFESSSTARPRGVSYVLAWPVVVGSILLPWVLAAVVVMATRAPGACCERRWVCVCAREGMCGGGRAGSVGPCRWIWQGNQTRSSPVRACVCPCGRDRSRQCGHWEDCVCGGCSLCQPPVAEVSRTT